MRIMDGNLVNGLAFMLTLTNTHNDGVGAVVYAPNVGGTQIYPYLAMCCEQLSWTAKGFFNKRVYI